MKCPVPGCIKDARSGGMCQAHYDRKRRHGDPLGGGTSPGATEAWLDAHQDHDGDDCLVWPFSHNGVGYGQATIQGRATTAHREMCLRRNGPPPSPAHEAAHTCGQGAKGCCNPKHLVWKTRAENQEDRLSHGTDNRGERHYGAKLTAADVVAIRNAHGAMHKDLAEEYGVGRSTITAIITRQTWAWL